MPTIAERLLQLEQDVASLKVSRSRLRRSIAGLTRWIERWAGLEQVDNIDEAQAIANEEEATR